MGKITNRKRSARVPGWKLAGYSLEEYLDGQLKLAADVSKARGTLAGPDPQVVLSFRRWIRRRTDLTHIPYPYSLLVEWFYKEALLAQVAMFEGDPAWVVVSVVELRRDCAL